MFIKKGEEFLENSAALYDQQVTTRCDNWGHFNDCNCFAIGRTSIALVEVLLQ